MAKKPPKQWIYSPKALPKPTVPEAMKQSIQEQCNSFIEMKLKPRHIQPPSEPRFSYIVDLHSQWYRNTYTLSYMRHTQKWQEVYLGLSLAECLLIIETNELFGP